MPVRHGVPAASCSPSYRKLSRNQPGSTPSTTTISAHTPAATATGSRCSTGTRAFDLRLHVHRDDDAQVVAERDDRQQHADHRPARSVPRARRPRTRGTCPRNPPVAGIPPSESMNTAIAAATPGRAREAAQRVDRDRLARLRLEHRDEAERAAGGEHVGRHVEERRLRRAVRGRGSPASPPATASSIVPACAMPE